MTLGQENFTFKNIGGRRMRFMYNVTPDSYQHVEKAIKKFNKSIGVEHLVIDEDISGNPSYCAGIWASTQSIVLSPFWRDLERRIRDNVTYDAFTVPKGFGVEPIKVHKRIPRKLKKALHKKYNWMQHKHLTVNNKLSYVRYLEQPTYSRILIKHICNL